MVLTMYKRIQMHFPDSPHSPDTFPRKEGSAGSPVDVVNRHMRKVEEAQKVQVHTVAPLAIRCALKNLVPHSLVRPKR